MLKKLLILGVLAGIGTTASGQATIAGTAHDLSGGYTGVGGSIPSGGEICKFCHTPHNALIAVPLWNHAASVETFTRYASTTLQGTVGAPSGISLECLSCHDGATNIDAYGGAAGSVKMAVGANNMGTDLSNDHPISITYNTADPDLVAPTGAAVGGLPLFGTAAPYTVECGSCHDPHGAGATLTKFLRASNLASAMCRTCHSK